MIQFEDWGLIQYAVADQRQIDYVEQIKKGERSSTLVFCQHPTVITAGRATEDGHVITNNERLRALGIDVVSNNRGGDVTVHNPGQLVGYPLFHLSHFNEDLHWFLREIEECIIQTLAQYNITGHRIDGLTGVWVENNRKICAIGIHCSRWVISHGFALNVVNDTSAFGHIIPCGIADKSVTSIFEELGYAVDFHEVAEVCKEIISTRFREVKKNL
jgi:lipoyl(octanoyl) transferase